MQFVDTHTHLYLPEFDNDREEVVSRALNSEVIKLLLPNINRYSVGKMLQMVNRYPGICYPMIGLHPTSVSNDYNDHLNAVREWIAREKFIAIGEVGIDLYWDKTFIDVQKMAFRSQVEIALAEDLPVVIHCRESFNEILEIISEYCPGKLKGVFHAFTGSVEQALQVIETGFLIGAGGIVTFKNAGLDKVISEIGPDSLILETDSPYLAPVPNRGKRNESANIPFIAGKIAELTGISVDDIARITTENAIDLFNLQD
ncbi:MAG TPA: TatD family hydrolase [Bacteroidales bacterium]|nr:TatD family hydrolase [Bacteroidales bacterium]